MTDAKAASSDFPKTTWMLGCNGAQFAEQYDRPLVEYLVRRGVSAESAREIVQIWWCRQLELGARGRPTIRESFKKERGRLRHFVSNDLWFRALDFLRARGVSTTSLHALIERAALSDKEEAAEPSPEIDEVLDRAREALNEARGDVARGLPTDQHRRYFELRWPACGVVPKNAEVGRVMGLEKHEVEALHRRVLEGLHRVVDHRLRRGSPRLAGPEAELLRMNLQRFGRGLELLSGADDGEVAEAPQDTAGAAPTR